MAGAADSTGDVEIVGVQICLDGVFSATPDAYAELRRAQPELARAAPAAEGVTLTHPESLPAGVDAAAVAAEATALASLSRAERLEVSQRLVTAHDLPQDGPFGGGQSRTPFGVKAKPGVRIRAGTVITLYEGVLKTGAETEREQDRHLRRSAERDGPSCTLDYVFDLHGCDLVVDAAPLRGAGAANGLGGRPRRGELGGLFNASRDGNTNVVALHAIGAGSCGARMLQLLDASGAAVRALDRPVEQGWRLPLLLLLASRDIDGDEAMLLDYGEQYWEKHRLALAKVAAVKLESVALKGVLESREARARPTEALTALSMKCADASAEDVAAGRAVRLGGERPAARSLLLTDLDALAEEEAMVYLYDGKGRVQGEGCYADMVRHLKLNHTTPGMEGTNCSKSLSSIWKQQQGDDADMEPPTTFFWKRWRSEQKACLAQGKAPPYSASLYAKVDAALAANDDASRAQEASGSRTARKRKPDGAGAFGTEEDEEEEEEEYFDEAWPAAAQRNSKRKVIWAPLPHEAAAGEGEGLADGANGSAGAGGAGLPLSALSPNQAEWARQGSGRVMAALARDKELLAVCHAYIDSETADLIKFLSVETGTKTLTLFNDHLKMHFRVKPGKTGQFTLEMASPLCNGNVAKYVAILPAAVGPEAAHQAVDVIAQLDIGEDSCWLKHAVVDGGKLKAMCAQLKNAAAAAAAPAPVQPPLATGAAAPEEVLSAEEDADDVCMPFADVADGFHTTPHDAAPGPQQEAAQADEAMPDGEAAAAAGAAAGGGSVPTSIELAVALQAAKQRLALLQSQQRQQQDAAALLAASRAHTDAEAADVAERVAELERIEEQQRAVEQARAAEEQLRLQRAALDVQLAAAAADRAVAEAAAAAALAAALSKRTM